MTCPCCKYEYKEEDWDKEERRYRTIIGDEKFAMLNGDFHISGHKYYSLDKDEVNIYTCPKCGIFFRPINQW